MDGITADQIMNSISVALIIMAAMITIDKVIDIVRKWKKPQVDVLEKLKNDKDRLDEQEKKIEKLEKGVQVINQGVCALLDHELHNGNGDQMDKARNAINDYLNGLILNGGK